LGNVASGPAWDSVGIDRYLLALAGAATEDGRWDWARLKCTAEAQYMREGDARVVGYVAKQDEDWLRTALRATDDLGRRLRRIVPVHTLVPGEHRRGILQQSVLSGPLEPFYRERWSDAPPTGNMIDAIVAALLAVIGGDSARDFSDFVASGDHTKWVISADFCLNDPHRYCDVYAFSVFPFDAYMPDIGSEIAVVFARDIKSTKSITPEMIDYLRSRRSFHFAFVVNRSRRLFPSVEDAQAALDLTLAMIGKRKGDQERAQDDLRLIRMLRQEANARNFNTKLFQDVTILAALAGFIALLLQREGRAELIGFFPDQDNMTTVHRAISYWAFAQNASAFAHRFRVPDAQIVNALPGPRTDGRKGIYYDELIRIPDFIAGAVSGTRFDEASPKSIAMKCRDLIAGAFVDNPNIALIQLDLPPLDASARKIQLRSQRP
jgi:hypothetical protein